MERIEGVGSGRGWEKYGEMNRREDPAIPGLFPFDSAWRGTYSHPTLQHLD